MLCRFFAYLFHDQALMTLSSVIFESTIELFIFGYFLFFVFFFQAEDGIRYIGVTGVQTCALPIFLGRFCGSTETCPASRFSSSWSGSSKSTGQGAKSTGPSRPWDRGSRPSTSCSDASQIGRASCRERV